MRRKDREIVDTAAILVIIEAADSCRLGLIDVSGPLPLPYVVALNYGCGPAGEMRAKAESSSSFDAISRSASNSTPSTSLSRTPSVALAHSKLRWRIARLGSPRYRMGIGCCRCRKSILARHNTLSKLGSLRARCLRRRWARSLIANRTAEVSLVRPQMV